MPSFSYTSQEEDHTDEQQHHFQIQQHQHLMNPYICEATNCTQVSTNSSATFECQFNCTELWLHKNNTTELPPELQFNNNSLCVVIAYCLMFTMAAVGNLTVFITLLKSRHRKSRISMMITHLAIADLLVTFVMIPLEIGWRVTVQWIAGEIACKLLLFLRAFGLYLSSNVLVCVSLDRYFAVLHPLRVSVAKRRGRYMLATAWGMSVLYSAPQSVVFHVQTHPVYPSFQQCVTFGFFKSRSHEVAYNMFCVVAMYFVPLLVICVAYTAIICEISKKSRETQEGLSQSQNQNGPMRLRRSDMTNIERARTRTLRMTATIVIVFVLCWTPYVVMTLWYMFDKESAMRVDVRIQDALFLMAVSNSCMNPLVYGSYAMSFRRACCNLFGCLVSPVHSTATLHQLDRKSTIMGSAITRSTVANPAIYRMSPIHPVVRASNERPNFTPPESLEMLSYVSESSGFENGKSTFYSDPSATRSHRHNGYVAVRSTHSLEYPLSRLV